MSEETIYPESAREIVRRLVEQAERFAQERKAIGEHAEHVRKLSDQVGHLLGSEGNLVLLALDASDHVLINQLQSDDSRAAWSSLSALVERTLNRYYALDQRAGEARRVWSDLERFMQRGWHLHIRALIKHDAAVLAALSDDRAPEVAATIDVIRNTSEEHGRQTMRRFIQYFDRACAEAGLPLDRTRSRHPKYILADGFFELMINESSGTARIITYEGRLADIPADVGAIVELIGREHQRIFDRPFEGEKFLAKLRRNYDAIITKEKRHDGDPVPIRAITTRLGKNEDGFRTDEFLIDLSRLVEQGPIEIEGRRLEFQHTKDTNKGMLLHGRAGQGYIGYILFRKGT
jgi:hypothetical protein